MTARGAVRTRGPCASGVEMEKDEFWWRQSGAGPPGSWWGRGGSKGQQGAVRVRANCIYGRLRATDCINSSWGLGGRGTGGGGNWSKDLGEGVQGMEICGHKLNKHTPSIGRII